MLEFVLGNMRRMGVVKALFAFMCAYTIVFAIAQGGNYSYGREKMQVAHGLLQTGTFTSGSGALEPEPGRTQPPGFVIVLAALGTLDAHLAQGLECAARDPKSCPPERQFLSLVALQALSALGLLYVASRLFRNLGFANETAIFALLLFLFTFRAGDLIRVTTGQLFEVTLALAHITFLIEWYVRRETWLAAASGLLLGAAILFNPGYASLLVFEAPLLIWAALYAGAQPGVMLAGGLAMVATTVATLAPWSLRNVGLFGDPWLTSEGELYALASRSALNDLGVKEWSLALLRWLPGMSDDVAGLFIPKAILREFFVFPNTVSHARTAEIMAAATTAATAEGTSAYTAIATKTVFDHAGSHLLTSIVLFFRGVFSGLGILGLIAVIMLIPVVRIHRALGRAMPVLLMVLPILGLALFQGLVTPNEAWRNLLMPVLSSYIIASLVKSL